MLSLTLSASLQVLFPPPPPSCTFSLSLFLSFFLTVKWRFHANAFKSSNPSFNNTSHWRHHHCDSESLFLSYFLFPITNPNAWWHLTGFFLFSCQHLFFFPPSIHTQHKRVNCITHTERHRHKQMQHTQTSHLSQVTGNSSHIFSYITSPLYPPFLLTSLFFSPDDWQVTWQESHNKHWQEHTKVRDGEIKTPNFQEASLGREGKKKKYTDTVTHTHTHTHTHIQHPQEQQSTNTHIHTQIYIYIYTS